MTNEQKIQRLKYHQELYYNGFVENVPDWLEFEPPLSDAEYDQLFDDVKSFAHNDPVITGVGAVTKKNAVKHANRMGSLAKVKDINDLKDWYKKYAKQSKRIVIMPKIDGLSLSIRYILSRINEAATRGSGDVGESVKSKVASVNGCPETLKNPNWNVEIRGEVVMPLSAFNELNRKGAGLLNPRNAAVGSLKRDDDSITATRGLKFWSYEIFGYYPTQTEKLEALAEIEGINVPDWYAVDHNGDDDLFWEEVTTYINYFEKNVRPNLDFATDGLVIALDSIQDQEDAGWASSMHHPNGKIAYKFKPEEKETEILGYHLQVGKTGRVIPVADIRPVILDGAEVSSPTLHNFGNMVDNGLFPGAIVNVVRANDVIPYIKSPVVKPVFRKNNENPVCPCCGSPTSFDGVNLWCLNEDCPARKASKIVHFIKTVECLNVGKETINRIIESGSVKNLIDLVNPDSVAEVATWMGSAKKNSREAEIVYNALKGIRNLPLNVFIESLGIHTVGTNTSKNLASVYKSVSNLVENANYDDLVNMDDIGPVTARSIMVEITEHKDEIIDLAGIIGISVQKKASDSLSGKSFLFTGTLSQPRKYFEGLVEANGGKLSGSVSKTLDYLIVGEDSGGKLAKAQKLGVKTIDETEFLKMLKGE